MPKNILKKYNIRPSKHLGQNFLIDKSALNKIINAADLSPEDVVLEIGPGLGVLTLELAKKVKKVIAVEKDRKMAAILREILAENKIKNVEIIESDILKIENYKLEIDWKLEIGNWKLIANIPYYITAPLIRKFLEMPNYPKDIVLLIQKEVAQRICAKPPRMSLLSVAVQFYAEPKIISYVSRKSFFPQPKVDSAIIKISPFKKEYPSTCASPKASARQASSGNNLLPERGRSQSRRLPIDKFFSVVKAGFAHPRKQLLNNLSSGLAIDRPKTEKNILQAGLQPKARPSELSVDNWLNLAWIIWGKEVIME